MTRDTQLQQKDAQIQQMNDQLQQKDTQLQHKDGQIQRQGAELRERNLQLNRQLRELQTMRVRKLISYCMCGETMTEPMLWLLGAERKAASRGGG